ncbi:MAG: hypothetical protein ACFHVJ_00225 [Aestuariibacter sp.]
MATVKKLTGAAIGRCGPHFLTRILHQPGLKQQGVLSNIIGLT